MNKLTTVHVLDSDHTRRAHIARCAFSLGHHAEVYADADELAAHAPETGVVIALDEAVQGGVGRLMRVLNREGRWLAVIATSTAPSIDKAVEALRQGATDYLELPFDPARLARSIEGGVEESHQLHARAGRHALAQQRLGKLSHREQQVVEQMSLGMTNKEIGKILEISPRTVEIHRTNAIAKLGARNSVEVVRTWFEAELDIGGYASEAQSSEMEFERLAIAS